MLDKSCLLTTKQVANFAADGLLVFPEIVPEEINREAIRDIEEKRIQRGYYKSGQLLSNLWQDSPGIGAMVRLPQVQAILRSLVGPEPLYDHHAVHVVGPRHKEGQIWHADNIIDPRLHFDIQLFYFAHDTPREMGGTMFLPGSHLRHIHETDIGRYQNFLGQLPIVCKAGTVAIGHHGIWHCAQPNQTELTRYMFKLRINPTVRQKLLWNTEDIDDPEIPNILFRNHRWYGNDDRLEYVQRIKLWRFLVGDDTWDAHYWLSRVENQPERPAPAYS